MAEHGLWYPPDPASAPWSTIGGNVATNAGGLCCVKYGVTRDYVLGLRAVVGGPPATARRCGSVAGPPRASPGYDLVGLFVGSEGTLGVVTEVTLRLRPALTDPPRTVVGAFDALVAAGRAVALSPAAACSPAALELLDRHCLRGGRGVEAPGHRGRGRRAAAGPGRHPGAAGDAEAQRWPSAFEEAGRAVGSRLHRRGRGRGAVRGAPAGLPGAGAARPGAHRGRLRAPAPSCRRCWPGSRPSPHGTGCRSPRSPTPETATCTRC